MIKATQLGLFPGCKQDYRVTGSGALVPIRPDRGRIVTRKQAIRSGPAAYTFDVMMGRDKP